MAIKLSTTVDYHYKLFPGASSSQQPSLALARGCQPHSAQEVFEFPKGLNESLSPLFSQQNAVFDTNTSSQDSQSWLAFSNSTPPQLDALHSQPPQGPSLFFDSGGRRGPQVRVACTHCQKTCKKCSDRRPCERCDRYGLPDCVDTTRKPRKKGIKRGPY
ncbi:uncharacterized protein IAS62_006669 [Cryptococcus decagattii]|uniref:Zn(2)-C6 fungal-type domain-containing protein n=1 Tax=Cryptococcus decagattii TaxID=1859122 RepID=A0ABZ2B7A5_9TREE